MAITHGEYQIIPSISIKPNYFVAYTQVLDSLGNRPRSSSAIAMPLSNISHGIISSKANKRVKNAIDWLINLADDKKIRKKGSERWYNYKVNFITLTLSSRQRHSDNEIKSNLLNQFLTELRTKWNCKYYMWRAEAQRNGNIHFHIVSDVFVPWRQLRTDWNRIQNKLGYVSAYTAKTGGSDPNSTDVHATKNIKNLSAYLAKYCSKNSKGYTILKTQATPTFPKAQPLILYSTKSFNPKAKFYRQVYGKLWGLSSALSKFKAATTEIDSKIEKELLHIQKNFPHLVHFTEKCCIFKLSWFECLNNGAKTIAAHFLAYAKKIISANTSPAIA